MVEYFNYTDPDSGLIRQCSMDKGLKSSLDKIKKDLNKKDKDCVMIIDGGEGSGKSVLAMQMCSYVDPGFNLDRISFNSEEFNKTTKSTPKGGAILNDEAINGLGSRQALSKENASVVALLQQVRQRNLFIVIVLPSVFMLDRYVSFHRSKGLVHTNIGRTGRHHFFVFNSSNKQKLLLEGKKTMTYGATIKKNNLHARSFTNYYANINEVEYRKKKGKAFQNIGKDNYESETNGTLVRNQIIYELLYKKQGLNSSEITNLFEECDINLGLSGIKHVITAKKREEEKKSFFEKEKAYEKHLIESKGGVQDEKENKDL